MNEEILKKILIKLENIDSRLENLEKSTISDLKKLHTSIEIAEIDQQEDIIAALQRIDVKTTAILKTQQLNFEVLKIFSDNSVQH